MAKTITFKNEKINNLAVKVFAYRAEKKDRDFDVVTVANEAIYSVIGDVEGATALRYGAGWKSKNDRKGKGSPGKR